MNIKQDNKMGLKLVQLIFYLLMYLHLTSCAWFYVIDVDQTWYPSSNTVFQDNSFYELSVGY